MLALVVGSPEENWALFNLSILTALVVASPVVSRVAECSDRLDFVCVATERALRAEAEFNLSQLSCADGGDENAETGTLSDDRASSVVPSTAPTVAVFRVDESANPELSSQLQRIASLGSREHWLINASDLRVAQNKVLGAGSYGVVLAGAVQGTPVAVKVPRDPANFDLSRSSGTS